MSKNKGKEAELIDIGKKLGKSQSKDALVKLLVQASTLLVELDQSPPQSTHNAMKGCSEALVSPSLLRHKDKEVGLLVAICISEIMRIVAPDAPYSDETLKEIFKLIVSNFKGLDDVNSASFGRRVSILETVAKVRSCVVMLDLECDDLILDMFEIFFDTASDEQPHNVLVAMRNVLTLVLEESEKIPAEMVEVILKNLLKPKKEGSAARKLAIAVVEKCADKLEPYVRSFLTSVMVEGKSLDSGLHKDHHEIIYELYGCAPQLLAGVIPLINDQLVKDKVNVRLKAVDLLGRLSSLPGRQFAQEYPHVFAEFLKRFSDKVVEVRVAVVNCAKVCIEANPTSEQANEIMAALQDRLLDYDEKVRVAVVKAIYDQAKTDFKSVPTDVLRKVSERLRDKKVVVRKATLVKLMELYKSYCTKCLEGSTALDKDYEWIPGKILRCCNDKELQGLETILTEQLFPAAVPVEEQSRHWVLAFSTLDDIEKKALQLILVQKQRVQQEMQIYLTTRHKAKEEEISDLEKKLQSIFKVIANHCVDSSKAEENLQKLHQMKDESIFSALSTLLDSSTAVAEATTVRDALLKKLGEEHVLYDFMKSLATKCGYFFFSREHVHAIIKEISVCNDSENEKDLVPTSLSLLVEIAVYCPELMADAEEHLLTLLKDLNESVKEGAVLIMAKAGASFRNKGSRADDRGNVNLVLEQLCLEGTRKQAKYAVSAIAAMTADSGLKALSVLYGRLVDKLEDNTHLPTILQSLGCIAQNAMPIFETREDDIIKFVVRNVLRRPAPQDVAESTSDPDTPSDHVLLKIYALKALVKSFLPKMNAHQRTRLPGLLKVLVKILACGEISDDMKTSDADKAHLRLAASKGVLRLARRWDSQIPIDVFHMVVMTVQDQAAHVRRALLRKIHHYLRDRTLNLKYASAYALCAVDTEKDIALEARRFMADFVDDYRKEAYKTVIGQAERTTITLHPEYALVYLVHVLAHHPNYPVVSGGFQPEPSAYEPFYRELSFYLRALIHQEADGKNESGKEDNLPLILAILRTIKGCENAVDQTKTETLYAICDIAILVAKDLAQQKKKLVETYPGVIPLPASIYKVPEPKVRVKKVAVSIAAAVKAADPKTAEMKTLESKVVEPNGPVAAEPNECKAAKSSASEVKVAEANESKTTETDEPMTEANENMAPATDEPMAEANENEAVVCEKSKPLDADESMVPESNQSASKGPVSGEATPPVGDEKTGGSDEDEPEEEPPKVDGSHLPPCFTDKDVLAKLKIGISSKGGQPASPRGRKRGKRVDNGETISDTEGEFEHSAPTPKKGKLENDKSSKGGNSGAGVIIKGTSRTGRKSVDKTESAKKVGKKPELGKEPEEDLDENTPAKRKRGRPKGSGKKDDGISGDEIAGPSSDSTPTTSVKKGKSATLLPDSGKRKPGRPAKNKSEDDLQEKTSQKKEKVVAAATPDKFAKKASAVEKDASPAWRNEDERGGDESLVGCGIKVWWPLDKKFYKGKIVDYDAKKKKHKILYDDGEKEVLNLAKERWELTDKQGKSSAKKEKTPTATPPAVLSGTKYPEPKRLKVTTKTPTSKDESAKASGTSKGGESVKSAKAVKDRDSNKTPKTAEEKESEKSPNVVKSAEANEQVASAFEFDDEGVEPEAKKRKTATSKALDGNQSKAEKAMSTSKGSVSENVKETSENKPDGGKDDETAEDDEPLDNWRTRNVSKSKPVSD
ncbi:sister chromatid cohesion protein PDS5 homolog A isoform X2 [Physcomitrium patens]|uniref:Uncharacterized protein n=1 Tax=Physcomitrium patens TaxID=3218 RepID=A0A7I4C3X3_PHYPA|nr:sister chromatid cohesion protein PDS5 homolog B-like isoform X4 [Physcomitrium patens]|eukprot:XP_024357694.1 sister chromatid cohesion protein PDS5 homolog B-like isoform X4 [Physcomitrella patens]